MCGVSIPAKGVPQVVVAVVRVGLVHVVVQSRCIHKRADGVGKQQAAEGSEDSHLTSCSVNSSGLTGYIPRRALVCGRGYATTHPERHSTNY